MAVYSCSGCARNISLSILPGGNPVALADPERWAKSWQRCDGCGIFCDSCVPDSQGACPKCGKDVRAPNQDDLVQMYFGKPPETIGDLPRYVQKGGTKERMMSRLQQMWDRGIHTKGEHEAYLAVLNAHEDDIAPSHGETAEHNEENKTLDADA